MNNYKIKGIKMNNNFVFAPRRCVLSNFEIKSVVAYIPYLAEIQSKHEVDGDFVYEVKFAKTNSKTNKNIKALNYDIVDKVFDNAEDCLTYCQNINNVIWDAFVANCNYDDYKQGIEQINNCLCKQASNKEVERCM